MVVIAGTNNFDVNGRCNSFLTELDSFLKSVPSPKILLVGLPARHDSPFMNPVVDKVNCDLLSLSNLHNNVSFVPLQSISRDLFTKHGLHLNYKGKVVLADLLINSLNPSSSTLPSHSNHHLFTHHVRTLGNPLNKNPVHNQSSSFKPDKPFPTRVFVNNHFLGKAQKHPEIPWAHHLKRGWGLGTLASKLCTKT